MSHKRKYTEYLTHTEFLSGQSTITPQEIIKKLSLQSPHNKPTEKIYLVSIDGSDNLTSEQFLKVKREQQVFTILASTPSFLERTLFVVVICYSTETKVHMFYENFSIEQKFQISFEPQKSFLSNNLSDFKWSSVFSKTSRVIDDLKTFIVSDEFQNYSTPPSPLTPLNKKVTLMVYMFLCGGNNQTSCKDFKHTIFHPKQQMIYKWYPNQSTADYHNNVDHIGSSAVWIFVLPDMISFSSLNDQKKLIKSINDEFDYSGIVSLEFPSDEFTLHTLLNEPPTISTSAKGMNTAINNKLLRIKDGAFETKIVKRVRNHRYLMEINKTHNGATIYRIMKSIQSDDFSDSMVLSIPDVHQVLLELQKMLLPFLSRASETRGVNDSVDFLVAKFNMISVLINNRCCWNQFTTNHDEAIECRLGNNSETQITTIFYGKQHQQFNSKVFQYLSTVFVGQPNYENERYLISRILMLVGYQCKLCNKKISNHQNFLYHYHQCISSQSENSWPPSNNDEKINLIQELKRNFDVPNFLIDVYSSFLQINKIIP